MIPAAASRLFPAGSRPPERPAEENAMSVQLNPYLNFRNNTREAMEFYASVFGGTLSISTFKEFQASSDPSEDDLVMHSQLEGEHGVVFMASDTPSRMEYRPGTNFSMSLSGDDETVLRGWFDALADGGTVAMPLDKAPWGDLFGMVTDRFGVSWLVNVSPQG
jgi:PhnB protein